MAIATQYMHINNFIGLRIPTVFYDTIPQQLAVSKEKHSLFFFFFVSFPQQLLCIIRISLTLSYLIHDFKKLKTHGIMQRH